MGSPSSEVAVLSVDRCLTLLSQHSFARVALSVDALPVVLPVSYVFDGNRLVIRKTPYRKLDPALRGAVVCFELDSGESASSSSWWVLVTGVAEQLASEDGNGAPSFAIAVDRIIGGSLSDGLGGSERDRPAEHGAAPAGA